MPEQLQENSYTPKISAIITCFNEEENISMCIESLNWCDEIIIVDSFSTDNTKLVALGNQKVKWFEREYYGAASQKNWAIDKAENEWVLILDADEVCSEELKNEIQNVLSINKKFDAFTMLRKVYFLGKFLKYSGWQNDKVIRLLKKDAGRCPNIRVHGGVIAYKKAPLLTNPLHHYMVKDLHSYVNKINTYGFWGASQLWNDKHKKVGIAEVIIRPLWRFIRTYFIELGILDGMKGFIACVVRSYSTFIKWAILWSWQKRGRDVEPELPMFDKTQENWYSK